MNSDSKRTKSEQDQYKPKATQGTHLKEELENSPLGDEENDFQVEPAKEITWELPGNHFVDNVDIEDAEFREEGDDPEQDQYRLQRIQFLNDQLRTTGKGGLMIAMPGFQALPKELRSKAIELLRTEQSFDMDGDAGEEHEMGMITIAEHFVCWNITYYDSERTGLSSDPSDPTVTRRVLTLMLFFELFL